MNKIKPNSIINVILIAVVSFLCVPADEQDPFAVETYTQDILTNDYTCVVHGEVTQTLHVAGYPVCQRCVLNAFPPLEKVKEEER